MQDILEPLCDEEIERLNAFLFQRIGDLAEDEGAPEIDLGVLDIAELDGLLTAVVSGPLPCPPSQWLPAVWGECQPEWKSEEDFGEIFTLMTRHMNAIAGTLMQMPEQFEPLFGEHVIKGRSYTLVDEWCQGYWRGVALNQQAWASGGKELSAMLVPILAFTAQTDWMAHQRKAKEAEKIQQSIAPSVRQIHAYWLARREEFMPPTETVRHTEPRVGRNDPCPCGSGKKYKKCCLH